MSDGFVVHLGGGLYLDSAGNVTTGPHTPATQVYKGAGGLKLDTDKISEALKNIADFLKSEETGEKIRKLGLSPKTLLAVLEAARVGAIAASFFSIAFLGLGVMLSILGELAKDDGISPEVASVLQGIREDMKAIDDQLIADSILSIQSQFHTKTVKLRRMLQDMVVQKIKDTARVPTFVAMQAEVNDLDQALSKLSVQNWSPLYRGDDYKEILALSLWLYTRNPDGSHAPMSVAPTVRRFDYRLGVPMYAYVATAYPILISTALPWYRSAGSHASSLRELANSIDAFVTRMYSESFARTIHHTAQSLFQTEGRLPFFVPHALALFSKSQIVRNNPMKDEFLVGAVDLTRYTDGWFAEEFATQLRNEGYDTGRRGAFDYSWPRDGRFTVLLDDTTMKEVNEQSARDFADLQVASGMLHLMTAAARLRFLSTPPLVSETVSGHGSGGRRLVSEEPATAKSPWIFPTGVIERPATIQHFESRAHASIQTQLPGYPFSYNYRIRLVSIDNRRQDAWAKREYIDNIWKGSYVPASGDARDQRLEVTIDRRGLLSSHLLFEGRTPASALHLEGTLSMQASTFDWYVPTRDFLLPKDFLTLESSIKKLASGTGSEERRKKGFGSAGSTSVHVLRENLDRELRAASVAQSTAQTFEQRFQTPLMLENTAGDVLREFDLTGRDQPMLDGAERRWVRQETVELNWQLDWKDGQLIVTVHGRPQDRPCQLYVIVEEDVYSGETVPANVQDVLTERALRTELHSAFFLEIVNQLTMVPKEFFDAERKAFAFGEKLENELNSRFAESQGVGPRPPSPVEFQRRLNEIIGDSQATASLAERQNRRFAFMREHVPEVLDEVLHENGIKQIDSRELDLFR